MAHGYYRSKDKVLARLRRIEGQVRGIQRMVQGDTYCIDILTQISAVSSALDKVAVGLLEDHINNCMTEGKNGDTREMASEASAAIDRLLRS